jgi:hypothetical protein
VGVIRGGRRRDGGCGRDQVELRALVLAGRSLWLRFGNGWGIDVEVPPARRHGGADRQLGVAMEAVHALPAEQEHRRDQLGQGDAAVLVAADARGAVAVFFVVDGDHAVGAAGGPDRRRLDRLVQFVVIRFGWFEGGLVIADHGVGCVWPPAGAAAGAAIAAGLQAIGRDVTVVAGKQHGATRGARGVEELEERTDAAGPPRGGVGGVGERGVGGIEDHGDEAGLGIADLGQDLGSGRVGEGVTMKQRRGAGRGAATQAEVLAEAAGIAAGAR